MRARRFRSKLARVVCGMQRATLLAAGMVRTAAQARAQAPCKPAKAVAVVVPAAASGGAAGFSNVAQRRGDAPTLLVRNASVGPGPKRAREARTAIRTLSQCRIVRDLSGLPALRQLAAANAAPPGGELA